MQNKYLRIALRILLALSLLLNVIVIGFALRLMDLRDKAGLQDTRFPREYGRAFMAQAQDDPALLAQLNRLSDARRTMVATAEARPFDPAALEAAMQKVRQETAALQVLGQALMLDVVSDAAQ